MSQANTWNSIGKTKKTKTNPSQLFNFHRSCVINIRKEKNKNNISLNTKAYEQPFFIPKETLNEFNFYIINFVKLF